MFSLFFAALQIACVYPSDPTSQTPGARRALATACRDRLAVNPQDVDAYRILAHALHDSPQERLAVLQAGLRTAPDHYELQFNIGLQLRVLRRLDEALRALRRAATLELQRGEPLVQAGLVAQDMGRHDEALTLFRDALRRAPRDGHAWGYRARSFYVLGRHAEALGAWDRAERLTPNGFIDEAGDRDNYERSRAAAGHRPS